MKVGNVTHLTLVILLSSAVPLATALNTICENRFNDLSFADPASCSSFYVCQRGNAVRRECSNGLYFDPKIQTCNLPGLVKCFNGERGVALLGGGTPNQTQKAVAATTARPLQTTTLCPPTTTTGHHIETTKKAKIVSATTKSPIEEAAGDHKIRIDVLRSSRDCRGVDDGVYLTDPRHCRRYYMCLRNRAKRHSCPPKQWFNRELLICQDQAEVLNCPSNRN